MVITLLSSYFAVYLEQLRSQNVRTQGFRFAQSTRKNYISHVRTWFFFSCYFDIPSLPAAEEHLCLFMELMSNTAGYEHCKNILGGVKYLHGALGLPFPSNSFSLDTTMQGLKRRLARTPFQVLPVNPTVLKLMYRGINVDKKEDLALWSSFLVAFYCLFRKANVVPENSKSDFSKVLTRENVEIDEINRKVYIYVGFSKTNQYRKYDRCIPIPENDDPCLDLFRHIKRLFSIVHAPPNAPAFSYTSRSFINYKVFTTRMKKLLGLAGLNPDFYSGHSFRRGGASFLFSVGASQLMVQVLGNWSSMVYTRYLYLSEEDRLEAQSLMKDAINSTIST
jgi:hypothetical protein